MEIAAGVAAAEQTPTPLAGRIAGRAKTALPAWVHATAVGVVVVNFAKFPATERFVIEAAAAQPDLGEGLSDSGLLAALRVGIGVVTLFSAIAGVIALYSLTRHLLRRQSTEAQSLTPEHRAGVLGLATGLLLPDMWAVFDAQPLLIPWFWALFLAVALGSARLAGARSAKSLAIAVGIALGGVLL